MDPAALGTLRIGLDAIAAEARLEAPRNGSAGARCRPIGLRMAAARALRDAADVLDPRALREAHSRG